MRTHKHIGLALKKMRTKKNWSRSELARACGITSQFISNMERGACDIPIKQQYKMCHIMGGDIKIFINAEKADVEDRYEVKK